MEPDYSLSDLDDLSVHVYLDIVQAIKENKIDLTENGFYFLDCGRHFSIYYVEAKKVCSIYAERSAVKQFDILVFGEPKYIEHWDYPNQQKLSDEEALTIHRRLVSWLDDCQIRHDITTQ